MTGPGDEVATDRCRTSDRWNGVVAKRRCATTVSRIVLRVASANGGNGGGDGDRSRLLSKLCDRRTLCMFTRWWFTLSGLGNLWKWGELCDENRRTRLLRECLARVIHPTGSYGWSPDIRSFLNNIVIIFSSG